MSKFIKTVLLVLAGIAVALILFCIFTASKTEFNFGNDGKILCITQKDWGFLSAGKINCFTYQKIGDEKAVQTYKCNTLNGEIVLSR